MHAAKYVAEWHTSIPVQGHPGAIHRRGWIRSSHPQMGAAYRVRHELVTDFLARELPDHLEVLPSAVGLHISAIARTAFPNQLRAVVRRSYDAG